VPRGGVFVHDQSATHRDASLSRTDPGLLPEAVVGYYTGSWNSEPPFQELRSGLGLERTCGWCAQTVPDGAARGAVPVRAVQGRGAALAGAAGVEAVGASALAGQVGGDVPGRAGGGAALAVGGEGFDTAGCRHAPRKTPGAAR
jgi:hypothetical protein